MELWVVLLLFVGCIPPAILLTWWVDDGAARYATRSQAYLVYTLYTSLMNMYVAYV